MALLVHQVLVVSLVVLEHPVKMVLMEHLVKAAPLVKMA